MEKVEIKQIDVYQLKKLQNFDVFMKDASTTLGNLTINYEFQKSDILNQIHGQQQKLAELEKEIKEQYGNIRVNIETGEITDVAEE